MLVLVFLLISSALKSSFFSKLYMYSYSLLISTLAGLFSIFAILLQPKCFKISWGFVTRIAPFFINLLVPIPALSSIACGIQNTFLLNFFAYPAVILVPLFTFASITNVPTT